MGSVINKIKRKISNTSDLNKLLFKSGFWILFGTLISKFFLLLGSILITKFVDKTVYGEVGILRSTINMFSLFAGLGLGLTATKFIAQYKDKDNSKVSRIIGLSNVVSLGLSFLISIIFFLSSDLLSYQINAIHLSNEIKLCSIILFFAAINGVQNGIMVGFQEYKANSINNIVASIVSVIFQVLGAIYYGLNGIILGIGFNFFLLYILNQISIRKITKETYNFSLFSFANFKEINIIWRFSIPALLTGVMYSPIIWMTNSFLVNQNNGYKEMANFDIANQWRLTILFIPSALAQIVLPMLSSTDDMNKYQLILKRNMVLNFVISTIIVLFILIFLPLILKMYGSNYIDSKSTFIVMFMSTILVSVNSVIGQAIASKDKMWIGFIVNVLWGIAMILTSYYFVSIKNYGSLGLAYAYLLSYLFHTFVQYYIYKKYILKFKV